MTSLGCSKGYAGLNLTTSVSSTSPIPRCGESAPSSSPTGFTLELESKVAAGRGGSQPVACGDFCSLVFWKPKSPQSDPVVSASVPRLAVLPFESRTPGEENQALSYTITDSLITRLARLSQLQVTSWTSVLRLTERKATVPEIAKLLKVDYILEGSFLKTG